MPQVLNKHIHGNPPGSKYIGRGSSFGNQYIIGVHGNRDFVCDAYEKDALNDPEFIQKIKEELRGCDLVCFCKPKRCHGDFLLKIANED